MRDMWLAANEFFRLYMGTGLVVIFFLAALVYLFLTEKRKPIRILFVYMPLFVLVLFFNPLVTKLVCEYADNEIYYRILWLLPITMVLAYAVVKIYAGLQDKKKIPFSLAVSVLIMVSGSLIYNNGFWQKAENIYHVPQSVVEICDAIEVEGREVMAVFPKELIAYVRQYSPVVRMPYGRENTVDRWIYTHELYDVMEAEEVEAERLSELARKYFCAYIILSQDKVVNGKLQEYDFVNFGATEGYVIYKDSTVDLELR